MAAVPPGGCPAQGESAIRPFSFLVVLVVCPPLAFAGGASYAQHMRVLDRMMVEFAPESARASATVREEYRDYLEYMVLDEFASLEIALANGGLVPLPAVHERFNLRVRTEGAAPIAEKDLARQASYIAARPAAIGALLDIASRVKSGPLEITSLVRHSDYQDALRTTNANANTSVPMHTMGLAFDIALVNTPLATVRETRDVLRQMQRDGDILVIGERKQLVFHVVPHPSRLGYFTDVYTRALAGTLPREGDLPLTPVARLAVPAVAFVSADIVAIRPTDHHAAEWWAAAGTTDLSLAVSAEPTSLRAEQRSFLGRLASRLVAAVAGAVQSARHLLPA